MLKKGARIHVEDEKLSITASAFVDSSGCLRMWDGTVEYPSGGNFNVEVPIGHLIERNLGTGRRLVLTVEPAPD